MLLLQEGPRRIDCAIAMAGPENEGGSRLEVSKKIEASTIGAKVQVPSVIPLQRTKNRNTSRSPSPARAPAALDRSPCRGEVPLPRRPAGQPPLGQQRRPRRVLANAAAPRQRGAADRAPSGVPRARAPLRVDRPQRTLGGQNLGGPGLRCPRGRRPAIVAAPLFPPNSGVHRGDGRGSIPAGFAALGSAAPGV